MEGNLNILEDKVLEAVILIKELRTENDRLKKTNQDLENRCAEVEEQNSFLNSKLEDANKTASEVEVYELKRKEIEDRVGGLLQKLEGLG